MCNIRTLRAALLPCIHSPCSDCRCRPVAACPPARSPRKACPTYIFCLISPKRLLVARPWVDALVLHSARAALSSTLHTSSSGLIPTRCVVLRCAALLLRTFVMLGLSLRPAAAATWLRRRRIPRKVAAHDVLYVVHFCFNRPDASPRWLVLSCICRRLAVEV